MANNYNARITELEGQMTTMSAKLDQLIAMMSAQQAQPKANTKKSTRKGAPKDHTWTRKDGSTFACTAKQYEFFSKGKERAEKRANRTPEEIAAAKATATAKNEAFTALWESTRADREATRPKGMSKSDWNKAYAAKLRAQM